MSSLFIKDGKAMVNVVSTLRMIYFECRDCGKCFSEFQCRGCVPTFYKPIPRCPDCGSEKVELLTLAIAKKILREIFKGLKA